MLNSKEIENILNKLKQDLKKANDKITNTIYGTCQEFNLEDLGQSLANYLEDDLNNKDKLILNAIKSLLTKLL